MADTIIASARAVAEVARDHARQGEQAGLLAAPVREALAGTGLLRMGKPGRLGGPEVDPVTAAEAVMAVAEGDASAAWYPATSSTHAIYAHYLPDAGAQEVFDGTAPVACASMPGGSGHFTGDGGLRVEGGRWPWASAAPHADWTGVAMLVDGRSVVAFLPAEDIVVEGGWDALGLRATASGDISVRPGALVPARRLADMTVPAPRHRTPLALFPLTAYVSFAYAAVALGNAAGAVADLLDRATGGTLAESPLAHIELARAEARLAAARAFLLEALDDMWRTAQQGATAGTRARARGRLAMSHAAAEAAAVADAVHALGGGAAVRASDPLQRRLRDAHTVTQHVQVTSRVYPLYGRLRFGAGLDVSALRHAT
ncbi:acyl-CoA dehydrogenase family protein [Nocardiopsis halophila]|uniref:hypothetical protein n=1 Tax=Nocardiopsis halophila TaxID=141692 RepID=UPI00034CEBCB|nr:hypothetical protein [Nocardiopsis halophila]